MGSDIFEKQGLLKPSVLRTVAERFFGDAEALRKTSENARVNGVASWIGFVVEILLKAKLVERYPHIARMPQHLLRKEQRKV